MGEDALEPRKVAAGLSEAQKRWLTESYYGSKGWMIVGYREKACDLGICHPRSSAITPLGLAVRAILEENHG